MKKQIYYRPNENVSLYTRLSTMLQRVNLEDIFSSRLHSRDFCNSRAEYISIRIRTLALVFAILAPLWIPFDYVAMESATFVQFLVLRLGFSLAFFGLSMWGTRCTSLLAAHIRITLFITILGLFYLISHRIMPGSGADSAILHGYSFLPLLVMALMTIVPLTLLEGLGYLVLIISIFIITQLLSNSLLNIDKLEQLWLLLLLGVTALWVQSAQLHMLLRLYREATRDALTGLVNRRVLSSKMEAERVLQSDSGHKFCVLLFDLDLFKRINDTYGHHTGDMVLQAFSGILQAHCQDNTVAGRYGGEEFLVIIPDSSIDDATRLAERIRLACHHVAVCSENDEEIHFTTSVGVAQLRPTETVQEVLVRVDSGLYQAKVSGRDLVTVTD